MVAQRNIGKLAARSKKQIVHKRLKFSFQPIDSQSIKHADENFSSQPDSVCNLWKTLLEDKLRQAFLDLLAVTGHA